MILTSWLNIDVKYFKKILNYVNFMLIYVNITEKTDRRTNKNFKFIVRNLTKVKISNKYH